MMYLYRQIKYNVQTKQFEYIFELDLPLHINGFRAIETYCRIGLLTKSLLPLNLSFDQSMWRLKSNRIAWRRLPNRNLVWEWGRSASTSAIASASASAGASAIRQFSQYALQQKTRSNEIYSLLVLVAARGTKT